jgi:ribonuclease E
MADTNKMLIDATHPEETRVVVLRGGRVEEFDYESAARKQLRGSIYLAKVTRVEPSLQAAFVDYGGNRHGFLAFNEIHPDYYQIPVADRQALLEEEAAAEAAEEAAAEARSEARARRDAARAAAKAARSKAAPDTASDADDDYDDYHDDIDEDAHDDDDAEVTDLNAEAAAADNDDDDDDDGNGETEDNHDGQDQPAATADPASEPTDASGPETRAPRSLAEEHGLYDAPRLTAEIDEQGGRDQSADAAAEHEEIREASAETAAGDDDASCAEASAENVTDDDLDRDSPEPHGLVEDQGVRDVRGEPENETTNGDTDENVEQVGTEDALEELPSRPRRRPRSYKIQEVIKRRQVVLVQVVKEERGNKGAALTTYLSLAGRYTVLMPNTARGGGISRKITQPQDRKRLKAIAAELDVPEGMGLIIRTAGAARTKQEIKRDFEYLLRLWESVRELTLHSTAPSLVYEEGNLIKRSIRDLYNKEVEEIIVAGDDAHREAKDFMRMLMPSHAKNVIQYQQPEPLFTRFQIERQLNAMFSPYVTLKSGGYLVINQTEALVAIDVNSGKATREFSIEETAAVTNCEAAEEIARQLKLRDLAGLIVIDFIDMEEKRNNRNVERRLKEALKLDRARIQVGRISHFGLLEMSRQRLRTGVLEGSTSQCPHCQGTGIIRSVESVALAVLRGLEDAVMAGTRASLTAVTTPTVALYILNKKRPFINAMEDRHGLPIAVEGSEKMHGANFSIERGPALAQHHRRPEKTAVNMDWGFEDEDTGIQDEAEEIDAEADALDEPSNRSDRDGDGRRRRRRRRGRRGERDDRESLANNAPDDVNAHGQRARSDDADSGDDDTSDDAAAARADHDYSSDANNGDDGNQRRRRRRGRRGGRRNRERLAQQAGEQSSDQSDGDIDGDRNVTEYFGDEAAIAKSRALETGAAVGEAAPQIAKASEEDVAASPDIGEPASEAPVEAPTPSEPESITTPSGELAASTGPRKEFVASGSAPKAADQDDGAAVVGDETDSELPRTPRGELAATAPKLERVVVTSGTAGSLGDDEAASGEAPTRKGWWQRRFGG